MKKYKKLLSAVLVVLLAFSSLSVASLAAPLSGGVKIFEAYKVGDDEVDLRWSAVDGADGYYVYIYNETTNKWKRLAKTSKTNINVEDLQSFNTYKFRVKAYKKQGTGEYHTSYTKITVTTAPDEVENVKVRAKTQNSVTFKWSAVKGAKSYEFRVYDVAQGKYIKKQTTDKTTVKVTGLKKGRNYRFKVRACTLIEGKLVYGEYSDVLSVKTKGTAASSGAQAEKLITKAKAESVALNNAGLKKSQVKFFECKLDAEKGVKVYEVEFYYSGYEYDYEINAVSGKIVKAEKERADK